MQFASISKIRNNLYFFSLALMLLAMPLSKALLSISLFLLVISWIIAPGFKERIQLLKEKKSILIFLTGFFMVASGLFYSENIQRNIFLLFNIKIALALLPVIIGTSGKLTLKELKILLVLFTSANIIACTTSTLILFQIIPYEITDVRDISIFVESIRFALLLVLNILILLYVFWKTTSMKHKITICLIIAYFVFFLNLMQALTGILALIVSIVIISFIFWKKIKRIWRIILITGLLLFTSIISWFFVEVAHFYHAQRIEKIDPESVTENNNPYFHDLSDTSKVNGYLINIYVCEKELYKEWGKVSGKSLDSLDARKYCRLKYTLISYMSSKGLRKDSAGFSKLSKRDIKNIEFGYQNAALADPGLKARIYDIVREFDVWHKTGKPDGSITIRINAMVNGWKVFIKNPVFGTGYGDINDDIQKQFEKDNQVVGEQMRQNPHNQFFTVLIGSGITGFIIFLISLIVPGIIENKYNSYLFLASFCVVVLSFLSDDTLERMVGCIITGFFFSLFLYAVPDDIKTKN